MIFFTLPRTSCVYFCILQGKYLQLYCAVPVYFLGCQLLCFFILHISLVQFMDLSVDESNWSLQRITVNTMLLEKRCSVNECRALWWPASMQHISTTKASLWCLSPRLKWTKLQPSSFEHIHMGNCNIVEMGYVFYWKYITLKLTKSATLSAGHGNNICCKENGFTHQTPSFNCITCLWIYMDFFKTSRDGLPPFQFFSLWEMVQCFTGSLKLSRSVYRTSFCVSSNYCCIIFVPLNISIFFFIHFTLC